MSGVMLERAARRLCELRQQDPDEVLAFLQITRLQHTSNEFILHLEREAAIEWAINNAPEGVPK